MRIWHAMYRERGSWGFYDEEDAIIIADDAVTALEIAESKKPGKYWDVEEITHERNTYNYISRSCS